MTLIGPENYLALLSVILGLVWFGFWSESHPLLRKIPGVLWILTLGLTLSNLGIIPFSSPLYGVIFTYILPLAVPMLLFKATLTKILRESGKVLPIFMLGAIAVCIGSLVATALFDLGPIEPKIAATYAAAWIGGVVNFVAMSEITQLTPSEFAVALGASNPVSVIGLAILCLLPSLPLVRRHIPSKHIDEVESGNTGASEAEAIPLVVPHIVGSLALSAAIGLASYALINSGWFPADWKIDTYNLFIITLITVVLANVAAKPLGAIKGDFEFGMLFMYLFFAAIGATTDVVTFMTEAPMFFMFGLTIIVVHVALMLLCGKILKFDLAELIIGSGANIVGAAPAAGIASSRGWNTLVTPAIATGMLGYAIANFFGIALFKLLG